MAKRKVLKTERGVTLTEDVLFGGEPRRKIDIAYTVTSRRRPEGKTFDSKTAATKYYKVQVSFSPQE